MRIYISTHERSGSLYAGLIAAGLKRYLPHIDIVRTIDRDRDAPVGFGAGLSRIPSTLRQMKQIEDEVRKTKPDIFLAVAWSEPNILLGLRLRGLKGMRRVFFAPPQLWAWGRFRTRWLKKGYHSLVCLYPGEARFMKALGLNAHFAYNPLATFLEPHYRTKWKMPGDSRTIALLPGSREKELKRHLPLLDRFRQIWKRNFPRDRFVWLLLNKDQIRRVNGLLSDDDVVISGEQRYSELAKTDLAVVASGTACLETALIGTPQIVFYTLPRGELVLAKLLTRASRFALPNIILAADDAVSELLNPAPEDLLTAAESTLTDPCHGKTTALRLRRILGGPLDKRESLFRIILN